MALKSDSPRSLRRKIFRFESGAPANRTFLPFGLLFPFLKMACGFSHCTTFPIPKRCPGVIFKRISKFLPFYFAQAITALLWAVTETAEANGFGQRMSRDFTSPKSGAFKTIRQNTA